jgi:anhydro-N-acetylmuramic acid kinase
MHPEDEYPNATLQIGDGDHIAVHTGIITVSDFRQKHVATGGEGAPLAVYGDHLMFSHKTENRVMLNIGGISNFTFLPANAGVAQVFSTDVGPGNTMMDAYIQKNFEGKYYDKDAMIAKEGKVIPSFLAQMLKHSFFSQPMPKTTGPETFNLEFLQDSLLKAGKNDASHADVMATLAALTGKTIANAIRSSVAQKKFVIYASGGGMHNPLVMEHIKNELPDAEIRHTSDLGIDPDAKEAVLFAVLANELVSGMNKKTGDPKGMPAISMGKISLPD